MKFDQPVLPYLQGDVFSNGLRVLISSSQSEVYNRLSYIEMLLHDKKVIHVGFADHPPLIESKIKNDTWMHGRLLRSASRCIGVDTNSDAVNYLKRLGYNDIFCADILTDELAYLWEETWDYIFLGELLEHLEDPLAYLQSISQKYGDIVKYILVSVPNAFAFENFVNVLKHQECINTDHKYWFTPFTLGKLFVLSNIEVVNFLFSDSVGSPQKSPFRKFIKKLHPIHVLRQKFPGFSETLIMEGKL
jgi:hypothetical protein